jgi:hypothetical protein
MSTRSCKHMESNKRRRVFRHSLRMKQLFKIDESSLPLLTQDSLATTLQKLSTSPTTSSVNPLLTFIITDQKQKSA